MKTKKQKLTQGQLVTEFINNAGFITTRHAQSLNINNPYEIIRLVKQTIPMASMKIKTPKGQFIKVHYTSKKAALGYVKFIGGRVV